MGGGVGGEVLRLLIGAVQPRGRPAEKSIWLAERPPGAAALSEIPGQWVPNWHGVAPQSEQGRAGWQVGAVP